MNTPNDRPLSATMQAALLEALIEGENLNEPPALRWLHAGGTRRTPPQTKAALITRGMAVANGVDAPQLTAQGITEAARIRAVRRASAEPAGHSGLAPEHAHDPTARQAVRDLAEAGLPLADIPRDYDPQTSTATGYMVVPQGADEDGHAWVHVHFLTPDSENPAMRRAEARRVMEGAREAARVLRAAGWAVDPLPIACARACMVPAPQSVPQRDRSAVAEIVRRPRQRRHP